MGESLVKAHRIGEDAQWLGLVVDETVAEASRKTVLGEYIATWDILGKNGVRSAHSVLNWVKPYVDKGSLKPPIALADFYRPFACLFGPYDALASDVKRKYESTVAFLNAHPVSK
jgi:hypothetical protein